MELVIHVSRASMSDDYDKKPLSIFLIILLSLIAYVYDAHLFISDWITNYLKI
jgi:hypothetical protein